MEIRRIKKLKNIVIKNGITLLIANSNPFLLSFQLLSRGKQYNFSVSLSLIYLYI